MNSTEMRESAKRLNRNVASFQDMQRTYTAVIHKEEGVYVATCPEIGTTSQGSSIEEAVVNLKEATELYLEEFPQKDGERSVLTTFEVALDKT